MKFKPGDLVRMRPGMYASVNLIFKDSVANSVANCVAVPLATVATAIGEVQRIEDAGYWVWFPVVNLERWFWPSSLISANEKTT